MQFWMSIVIHFIVQIEAQMPNLNSEYHVPLSVCTVKLADCRVRVCHAVSINIINF